MDINFPLILVIAVFVTGVVWLIDKFFFQPQREQHQRPNILVEYCISFFPVLFVVLILRSFIVEPFKIPSSSMVPTLLINDFILVNKFSYGIRLPVIRTKVFDIDDPKRGDVMVFFPPNDKRYFIKRVIGIPGDEIRLVNNVLFINGEKMKQTFIEAYPPEQPVSLVMLEDLIDIEHLMQKNVRASRFSNYSITVPEGSYFMMGDNRDNSSDSRRWGVVPEENIVGKAFAVWMHWDSWFSLPKFSRNGLIE